MWYQMYLQMEFIAYNFYFYADTDRYRWLTESTKSKPRQASFAFVACDRQYSQWSYRLMSPIFTKEKSDEGLPPMIYPTEKSGTKNVWEQLFSVSAVMKWNVIVFNVSSLWAGALVRHVT